MARHHSSRTYLSQRPHLPTFLAPFARSSSVGKSRRSFQPRLEPLEDRTMLSVAPLYYSVTGAGNNLANPNWGVAGSDLLLTIPPAYGDGISSPGGANLPSARLISNVVGAQTGEAVNNRDMSAFVYAWGQFIDHDLDMTPSGGESLPIAVPTGDPSFDPNSTGTQTLPFTRALYDPATGTSTSNPRDPITNVTSFLDGSQVYGSDPATAAALRTFSGGQLKTSAGGLLPLNSAGLNMENDGPFPETDMFMAGDVRANENVELTSIQTLFVREHNYQASLLARQHPRWTDEQLYQGARQIVIAEIQSITFNEFLPALLGSTAIAPYSGYDPTTNPGITPEFSEAAYRFGHSLLDNEVNFLSNNGQPFSFTFTLPGGVQVPVNSAATVAAGEAGIPLTEAFSDPYVLEQPGAEAALLKYLASDLSQEVDGLMVDNVRNFLFGQPGQGGFDLFALDIQRGRDVGLPDFNTVRQAYGLAPVTSFSQISSDPAVQAQLQQLYGKVDNVDLFVGGMVEDHAPGSSVGATFQAIIADQFERIRDGDRLWYQNIFSGRDLQAIQNTTLADIIRRDTTTTNLQNDVFIFQASISGTAFLDTNGNGVLNRGELPLPGIVVQLLDSQGNVVDTTRTARDGSYQFNDLELGQYRVRLVVPPVIGRLVPLVVAVDVTRGGTTSVNFAVKLHLPTMPPSGPSGPSAPLPGPPGGHSGGSRSH